MTAAMMVSAFARSGLICGPEAELLRTVLASAVASRALLFVINYNANEADLKKKIPAENLR